MRTTRTPNLNVLYIQTILKRVSVVDVSTLSFEIGKWVRLIGNKLFSIQEQNKDTSCHICNSYEFKKLRLILRPDSRSLFKWFLGRHTKEAI